MNSKIQNYNGFPTLFINNKPFVDAAYISYLEENARYEDFAKMGFRLYSFASFFAGRPINVISGIKPFEKGIFDNKECPDFSSFDSKVESILRACPDAYILPRVNVMMPEWWEKDHPEEVNRLRDGTIMRESFSSDIWRAAVGERLLLLIDHIENSCYREHIIGYHIAGGQTEEFYHFGSPDGGRGDCAEKEFLKFIDENYPEDKNEVIGLPQYTYSTEQFCKDKTMIRFLEYSSVSIVRSIAYFASVIKKRTQRELIVGAFYGYTMELSDPRFGHNALMRLLQCDDIDFLAAPNSYAGLRRGGIDWASMTLLDSIKLHGKFFFCECDTRTALTKTLAESRKNSCLPDTYEGGVWSGPDSVMVSRWLLRNNFSRALTHGCGLWWFDMWGGWYANTEIMNDLAEYNRIAETDIRDRDRRRVSEVAVITDEISCRYINPDTGLGAAWNGANRLPLGLAGAPYDIYDISDLDKIACKYKLTIFLATLCDDGKAGEYIENCINTGLGVMLTYQAFAVTGNKFMNRDGIIHYPDIQLTTGSLRDAYKKTGVHIWCDSDDVLYASEHYVSLHCTTASKKTIVLKTKER